MHATLTPKTIQHFIETNFDSVVPTSAWGETAFFYNKDLKLKRGTYFATLKEKDGDNDKASHLDRDGVWRFNLGLPKPSFIELFETIPKRPAKGQAIAGDWNFKQLDILMPHPVYGWMGWIAINNPSEETFETLKPLISLAHEKAKLTFNKRVSKL